MTLRLSTATSNLMDELARREDFLDLVFHCVDGHAYCHRFVISAHSKFISRLLLEEQSKVDDVARISLPGVSAKHMRVVLDFFYTGTLLANERDRDNVSALFDLLLTDFRVLQPQSNNVTRLWQGDNGLEDSSGGREDSPRPPAERRSRSVDKRPGPLEPSHQSSNTDQLHGDSSDLFLPTILATDHLDEISSDDGSIDGDASICEVLVGDVSLHEVPVDENQVMKKAMMSNKENVRVKVEDNVGRKEKDRVEIPIAPRIISRKTLASQTLNAPPEVNARRTGGSPLAAPSCGTAAPSCSVWQLQQEQPLSTVARPLPLLDRSLPPLGHPLPLLDRPPLPLESRPVVPTALPQPPREGMVIYRGQWVPEKRVKEAKKKKGATRGIRRYAYTPYITISGWSKRDTVEGLQLETSGEFPCLVQDCTAVFEKERSLKVHMQRSHNQHQRANCPECGKGLSTVAALAKHLLSHRPREEWPIECPLCKRRFQAKGDLPKHFASRIHRHEVPEIGSPQWRNLCEMGVVRNLPNSKNRSNHQGAVAHGGVVGADGRSQ